MNQHDSAEYCGCDKGAGWKCDTHRAEFQAHLLELVKEAETFPKVNPPMRVFETGATRNVDDSRYDYEGFLSPLVLERYAQFMHKNRVQADGTVRDSDNWQKGIPKTAYMKSGFRHFMEWWSCHRMIALTPVGREKLEEALCALMFNVMGFLHEHLKEKH